MKDKKIELLAPAGDLEKLKWAVLYAADAVYLGGVNYSLRANAKNFTLKEIKEGVKFAHEHGVKVYVTVNIVFHNNDVNGFEDYLKELDKIGVDAVIFSDPLVIDITHKNNLKLELHLSTQASILNKDAAKYYVSHGVSRIVLARECSKEDIKDIIKSVGCEVECFIHGAMCTNISGRCVLSNYFTNRDANRGGCCQVCRFNFNLKGDGKVVSDGDNFSIAPKDLSLFDYVKDMIEIGVASFKLEGRMRSVYYTSSIISVYRKLIDMYLSGNVDYEYVKNARKILYRVANREVAPQFFNKMPSKDEQYYKNRQEDSNQDFLGIVLDYDEEKKEAIIEQRNYFKPFDKVTVFGPRKDDYSFIIETLTDIDGNKIDKACHPREIVRINCPVKVSKNDLLRVNFLD